MTDLVSEVRKLGQKVGIYSSHWEWTQIFGDDKYCSNFTDVPLWYAHFDGVKTFDDFNNLPFGGWTQPQMKQYIDLTRNTVCGVPVDQDYWPSS